MKISSALPLLITSSILFLVFLIPESFNAASPLLESVRVWLPVKPWAEDLMLEAISFPNAAHDDQVDAMVMAIHYVRESWRLGHPTDPEFD